MENVAFSLPFIAILSIISSFWSLKYLVYISSTVTFLDVFFLLLKKGGSFDLSSMWKYMIFQLVLLVMCVAVAGLLDVHSLLVQTEISQHLINGLAHMLYRCWWFPDSEYFSEFGDPLNSLSPKVWLLLIVEMSQTWDGLPPQLKHMSFSELVIVVISIIVSDPITFFKITTFF